MSDLFSLAGKGVGVELAQMAPPARFFRPNLRPERIVRPRLVARLNAAASGTARLILVSAPAGYGKTALLEEWAAQSRCETVWYSPAPGDDSPGSFWAGLAGAIRALRPAFGSRPLALLEAQGVKALEPFLRSLLAELNTFPQGLALILDDFQAVRSPAVRRSLDFFVARLPARVRLFIGTRLDPDLMLASLRGRGGLAELHAADLRFTMDEAGGFLNECLGLDLPAEDVAALQARTGGWIAGLQLAGLALTWKEDPESFIRAISGSRGFILDTLTEQVLGRLQEPSGIPAEPASPGAAAPVEALTGRECEILRLIAGGATNGEIAAELVLTVNTVKKHTSNIFGKLGVKTRTRAVARARQLNLLI